MNKSRFNKGRPKYLDRKECFELWVELGTIPKVCLELERRGKTNPNTGCSPSKTGVQIAATKYILYNIDDARKVFQQLGYFGSSKDDAWIGYLKRHAMDVLTTRRSRYEEWERDILQPYVKRLTNNH